MTNKKKQDTYLLIGLTAILNSVTGNIIGKGLAFIFPADGLAVGELFSGLGVLSLLLSWHFNRKNKLLNGIKESKLSKYGYYVAISLFVGMVMFVVAVNGDRDNKLKITVA